jgi:hypothetical protein
MQDDVEHFTENKLQKFDRNGDASLHVGCSGGASCAIRLGQRLRVFAALLGPYGRETVLI